MNTKIWTPVPASQSDTATEREQLQKFLADNNLSVDGEFLNKICLGDIVEVYSASGNTQLYQNGEFARICSYTPEQMATIPFPKLFWREQDSHVSLMQRASSIIANETGCVPWNIANHELVESLHPRKRTFEMQMGFIAPCFKVGTQRKEAWASTLKVNFIFEWKENLA